MFERNLFCSTSIEITAKLNNIINKGGSSVCGNNCACVVTVNYAVGAKKAGQTNQVIDTLKVVHDKQSSMTSQYKI